MIPGHGYLWFSTSEKTDNALHCKVPTSMVRIDSIEIWRTDTGTSVTSSGNFVVENICGRLPAQDIHSNVRPNVVQKINRCFGRKFCIYALAGNVSFDCGVCFPQFRGVKKIHDFQRVMGRFNIETTDMTVHLIVLSGHLGRPVTLSEKGTLMQLLPVVFGYQLETSLDTEANSMRFTVRDRGKGYDMSLAITRRGCLTTRISFHPQQSLTEELLGAVCDDATEAMRCVSCVC